MLIKLFKMFVIIYTILCRNPELKFNQVIEVDKVEISLRKFIKIDFDFKNNLFFLSWSIKL
jgi:hypothetical protein